MTVVGLLYEQSIEMYVYRIVVSVWCAIDRLSRKFQCPFVISFTSQEIALNVKECIGLWSLFHGCCHDLDCFHLLVCA